MTSGGTDSSRRWLRRQHRDPFVAAARKEGLRSRAAFKLRQIDDRYRLLLPGRRIVDLGAAPGGWSQIAAERTGAKDARGGRVVAIDLEPFDPIPGVVGLVGDVAEAGTPSRIIEALSARADVVLSDMAVPATGHAGTDRGIGDRRIRACSRRGIRLQGFEGRHGSGDSGKCEIAIFNRETCETSRQSPIQRKYTLSAGHSSARFRGAARIRGFWQM